MFIISSSLSQAALVSYFPLDGTTGAVASTIDDVIDNPSHGVTDGTANNNTATWVNDPTRGSVLNSPTGNRFSAGTQDIDISAGNGFTWSFWAKASGADTTGSIIGTRNGTWHKLQFNQVDASGGFSDFAFRADGSLNNSTPTFSIDDGSWYHMGYVGDENGTRLYIDGVLRGGDTSMTATTVVAPMEIGGTSRFSEDVDVSLDEIAIYDQALTESQIIALSNGADPTTIPEPSAAILGAIGSLLLLRRRR